MYIGVAEIERWPASDARTRTPIPLLATVAMKLRRPERLVAPVFLRLVESIQREAEYVGGESGSLAGHEQRSLLGSLVGIVLR